MRMRNDSSTVTLTIADSGPGIATELRQRLFQPFAAGHSTGGTGLGLAICREIVASLGGSIHLDNRDNRDNREGSGRVDGLDATVRLPTETA